jgi:hypothetical protein
MGSNSVMSGVKPPLVKQLTPEQCWAACMESWSKVPAGLYLHTFARFPQKFLGDKYGEPPNNGLKVGGDKYKQFLADIRLTDQTIPPGQLTIELARNFDLRFGMYILVFQSPQMTQAGAVASHAVLVWDFDDDNNIHVMDPASGFEAGGVDHFNTSLLLLRSDFG